MASAKRRLPREERQRQLLDVAWRVVRDEGTEALTLGHLAELAGVTKPVVYDHFETRNGLLLALYREWDDRQNALMDEQFASVGAKLEARAEMIAHGYVDCVLSQGREVSSVIAALAGAPELERVKREWEAGFMKKCRKMLSSPGSALSDAALFGMLGAAEALSYAAARGDVSPGAAKRELFEIVSAMVRRSKR